MQLSYSLFDESKTGDIYERIGMIIYFKSTIKDIQMKQYLLQPFVFTV